MKVSTVYRRPKRIINESNIIVPKGTIKFSTSAWTDSFIQAALGIIAAWDNTSAANIQTELQEKIDEQTVKMYDKSPLLFDTIKQNAVESANGRANAWYAIHCTTIR